MIEQDIINHLKNDATLDILLLATATDNKMYPIRATQEQQENPPFIIYSVSPVGVIFSDLLDRDSIEFQIVDDSYSHAGQILDRLKALLEINDELRKGTVPTSIASSSFFIYSGIRSGGSEFQDPDTLNWVRIVIYEFAYKKKIA